MKKQNKKARSVSKIEFAIIGVLAIIGWGTSAWQFEHKPAPAAVPKVQQGQTSSISQKPQLEYVNAIRAAHGLAPLAEDPQLDRTAQLKATDEATRHYYSHSTPDGKPFDQLIYSNYPALRRTGENLARCDTLDEAFTAFEKSPEHLANIINPNFTLFGSYLAFDTADKCPVIVNHFGGLR